MLSEAEIEAYRRDGIVVPSFHLTESRLAEMRAALDQLLAANPENSSDSMLCPHLVFDAAQDVPGMHPLRGAPAWLEFAREPAILDMVEQLIGTDLILWGTTVFGKPAERVLKHLGIRTANTGRSVRAPPVQCGSPWTSRHRTMAVCG